MRYITTNHRFIIDDKHPADVFDDMENFFSLYTVAIDDLEQVSVQLSVPASFAIEDNKKLADGYRQFAKALKYTLPDIHLLPVKTHAASTSGDDDGVQDDAQDDDSSVILLIQRLEGQALDEDDKPSLYTSVLGKLLPRFGGDKTETGLYPVRETIAIPTPAAAVAPHPVPQPMPPTVAPALQPQLPSQPAAQVQPSYQPQPTQPPVPPLSANHVAPNHLPGHQPIAPIPVTPPPAQAVPHPQPHFQPTPAVMPVASQPAAAAPNTPERLPNIAKSAKPYQKLLTQAIVRDANKQLLVLKGKPIQQITLKSSDSLTTAAIEQLFFSFNHSKDKSQTAHDALDLVSYGHEVLKPQLAKLGLRLAEDAQFGLKTNHQATEMDRARLSRGDVFANEITLSVKLKPADLTTASLTSTSTSNHQAAPQAIKTTAHALQFDPSRYPSVNANAQGIALNLVVQDALGTRQQAIRQFPMRIVTGEQASRPDSMRVYGIPAVHNDELLRIVELGGNVMVDGIQTVVVLRNGQPLANGSILMPNDILTLDSGRVSLQLRLA